MPTAGPLTIPDSEAYVPAAVRVTTPPSRGWSLGVLRRCQETVSCCLEAAPEPVSWLPAEMNRRQAGRVHHGFGGPPVGRSRGTVARAAVPLAHRVDGPPDGFPPHRRAVSRRRWPTAREAPEVICVSDATRVPVLPHAPVGPPDLSAAGSCRCQQGVDTLMRDVGHSPTRPRLVVVAKIDTPPGPTKNPTTIRTMPRSTCPWKSWTIPAITRTTAMIHKMVAMAVLVPGDHWPDTRRGTICRDCTSYRHDGRMRQRTARHPAVALRRPCGCCLLCRRGVEAMTDSGAHQPGTRRPATPGRRCIEPGGELHGTA